MKHRHHPDVAQAVEKYREFHRYEPKEIVVGAEAFELPARVFLGGSAIHVLYRSAKVDPETLRRPRKPVDYIHDHDAGVKCYFPNRADADDGAETEVPDRFRRVPALARLGFCLGFCFETPTGESCEVESRSPFPELYTTPDGHCLVVVQSRRTILAMMWGGALGVFARGIDG